MKKILLSTLLILIGNIVKAQYIDPSAVITTSDISYRNVLTKKIIGTIKSGDTVYLKNIRIKPYFYVEYNEKQVLVSPHDLDSAIYITSAIYHMHELVSNISECIKKYGKKYGLAVANKDIEIGMTEKMILDIKGENPTKINRSHYSFGNLEQWVYENAVSPQFTEYYYFKNGRLTSWQD